MSTYIQKPTPVVATIDVQDKDECVISLQMRMTLPLMAEEIGSSFQDSSLKDEGDDK